MSVGNLSGLVKIDCALAPCFSTDAGAMTSEYYSMANFDKAIFIVEIGTGLTASGSATASILSAYSNTGGGSAALGVYTTMNGAPSNEHVLTRCKAAQINNASSWNYGDTVVINGITYTMSSTSYTSGLTTATFSTARYVYSSSSNTHASGAAQHLAAYINHATYGCTGVTATVAGGYTTPASSNNVYLATDGNTYLTITASTSDIQLTPWKFESILECKSADICATTSHKYIAVQVTPTSSCYLSAVLVRSGARFMTDNHDTVSDYDDGV